MKNNVKKIYFVTSSPFPVGGAGTVRKYSLAKGFIKQEYQAHIITIINEGNSAAKQIKNCDGVDYHCSGLSSVWRGGRIYKLYHLLLGMISAVFFILRDARGNDSSIITTNQYNVIFCFVFWITSKLCHAYFITELNENPIVSRKTHTAIMRFIRKQNIYLALRLYDDIYVMTYTLLNLLQDEYNLRKNVFVLHNTVDFDRFHRLSDTFIENQILYAGSLSSRKDSVDLLLRSIARVKLTNPNVRLKVCHFSNDKDLLSFLELIEKLGLTGQVELAADVPNYEIPNLMAQAELLILIRKPNLQTTYGFPTKLVEYLASGRPVIVSAVSDISVFLENQTSAYFVTQNTEDEIVGVINEALKNKDQANAIGLRGREIAERCFNNIHEVKKVIDRHSYRVNRKGFKWSI